eukprot:5598270-Amphidinium_carterae.1
MDANEKARRVTISEPEIEELVEFEVDSHMRSTIEFREQLKTRRVSVSSVDVAEMEVEGLDQVFVQSADGVTSVVDVSELCDSPSSVEACVIRHLDLTDDSLDLSKVDPQKASHTSVSPKE